MKYLRRNFLIKNLLLLIAAHGFGTVTKAQTSTPAEYQAAMSDPKLVASYNWWKLINPHNLQYTDTGIVNYSKRTELKLVGWINQNVNFAQVISNDSLIHLQAIKNLKTLTVRSDISDVGLYNITPISSLVSLTVSVTGSAIGNYTVTDRGMAYISKLANLQVLDYLSCPRVTDAGLNSLGVLTKLKTVNLIGWTTLTNNGLNVAKNWPVLESLNLSKCSFTDDAILTLSGASTSIKTLNLEFDNITNKGLEYLARFHSLKEVVLGHTKIDNSGEKMMALMLRSNPNLNSVTLFGTSITTDVINRLQTLFPNVAFHYN